MYFVKKRDGLALVGAAWCFSLLGGLQDGPRWQRKVGRMEGPRLEGSSSDPTMVSCHPPTSR